MASLTAQSASITLCAVHVLDRIIEMEDEMSLVQGIERSASVEARYSAAEATWFESNSNIIDVLQGR